MTPRLKRLNRHRLLAALRSVGFEIVSTRGSHAKLCRELSDGTRQVLTVPLHKELPSGTLHAIFKQAARFVAEDELRPLFFD